MNLRWIVPALLGAALVWWGYSMPVRELQVQGSMRYGNSTAIAAELQGLALGRPHMQISLEQLADAAREHDWVSDVRVVRRWPGRIEVQLSEHEPIARWRRAGRHGYINSHGGYFDAAPVAALERLPLLSSQDLDIGNIYQYLSARLGRQGLRIAHLSQGDDGAWRVLLDNRISLQLGAHHLLQQRIRRFERLWNYLDAKQAAVAAIDLRYEQAAAVRWHGPEYNPTKENLDGKRG